MNKVVLIGRLTRDPEVRYTAGANPVAFGRYTLAVDRRYRRENEPTADFINCVTFGRNAEFAQKYLKQGTKIAITGRIQTGSYVNRDGNKVYTTDVVVEEQEFAESKGASGSSYNATSSASSSSGSSANASTGSEATGSTSTNSVCESSNSDANKSTPNPASAKDDFMEIPDSIEEELPFN